MYCNYLRLQFFINFYSASVKRFWQEDIQRNRCCNRAAISTGHIAKYCFCATKVSLPHHISS